MAQTIQLCNSLNIPVTASRSVHILSPSPCFQTSMQCVLILVRETKTFVCEMFKHGSPALFPLKNEMKINPSKSKSISFTRARIKDPLNYTLRDQKIPEDSCCKYLRIIIHSDLSWADQVNHTVQKAWKALHFVMRVVKMELKIRKALRTSH